MAGLVRLVPAIHVLLAEAPKKDVDAREDRSRRGRSGVSYHCAGVTARKVIQSHWNVLWKITSANLKRLKF